MNAVNAVFDLTRAIAPLFLRLSMGVVLAWIGLLKFADPAPVVGLLEESLPFLGQ